MHIRYEDFLISKAQQFKEKLIEKAKELEHEQLQMCTFSPQINSTFKSSRQHSTQRQTSCVNDEILSDQLSGNRRPKSLEMGNQDSTKHEKKMEPSFHLQQEAPQSVFINLYQIAKCRKERSKESLKKAEEEKIAKDSQECTFKPDTSRTKKSTDKYLKQSSRSRSKMSMS